MAQYILSIDQGTTSSRAILFDENRRIAHVAQQEFRQIFPQSGWVEHDAEEIWQSVLNVCKEVLGKVDAADVKGIGITNQRETTVIWDRATGRPIHNAIVWQDRRTSSVCARLKEQGLEDDVTARSGLLLDPYFSATKVAWLLDNVEGARAKADAGELAFGTMDSFLLWRLTDGKVHATDATNAARTMLLNIHSGDWDEELLRIFRVPSSLLPEVKDNAHAFGETSLFGPSLTIAGMAGDQQAATVGQACFEAGMLKSTYGTGCFALLNTGDEAVRSENRLLTTIAYQLDGKPTYALEGSIFIAGAAVQWLRDGMGLLKDASQAGGMAQQADPGQSVYLVPAFTGLGAPYWDSEARGAMFGMTRNTGPNEFARAALQAVCYQTRDLLEAMKADGADGDTVLRVDGGMVASDWTMQFLADILDAPVDRPAVLETTALGAAYLAGLELDFYPDRSQFAADWAADSQFTPSMDSDTRSHLYAGWKDAVKRTLS